MYDNQFEYPLIFREHHGEYYVIETPEALVKHWPKLKEMGWITDFIGDGGNSSGDPELNRTFMDADGNPTAHNILLFFREWSLHDECTDENLHLVWKTVLD